MADYTVDTTASDRRMFRHHQRLADSRASRQRRNERREIRRESRSYRAAAVGGAVAGRAARAPSTVTSYSGNRVLAAELLAGFVIVAIRVVADYESQDDGTTKGRVFHPAGQYGPLPILAGLVISFFLLSLASIGGGTRAKMAVILGGCIVLTLGVKSTNEIKTVSGTIGKVGTIVIPGESGSEGSGASSTSTGSGTGAASGAWAGNVPSAANPVANSANAGNRAITSIKSPFTQNVLKGDINGIPATVGKDALNLAKGIADYLNAGAQGVWHFLGG